MKKTLTIVSLLAGAAVSVHAAGEIQWNSAVSGWEIYVYGVNYSGTPAEQATEVTGDTQWSTPSGSTVFGGPALGGTATGSGTGMAGVYNGNNYMAGLYVGSSTAAVAAALTGGTPLVTANFVTTGGAGNGGWWVGSPSYWGQLPNNAMYTPSAGPAGTKVYVGIAAWFSGGGAASYAAAIAAGVPAGSDGVSSGITLPTDLEPPPSLEGSGLESFDLTVPVPVPEPGAIALGVMGASAWLFRRRK
jgi:uncharacterized protein (TIGR03382 family)